MAKYKVMYHNERGPIVVEADRMSHSGSMLHLIKDSEIVATFPHYAYVLKVDETSMQTSS